jgi:hypothetical protein
MTFTVTSENASYPIAATQRIQPKDVFRTSGTSDFNIIIDQQSDPNYTGDDIINAIFFLYTNGDFTKVRIRAHPTDATVTNPTGMQFDTGVTPITAFGNEKTVGRFDRLHWGYWHPTTDIDARYIRFDWTTGNQSGDGYFEIGRIMCCRALVDNPSFGLQITNEDEGALIATRSAGYRRPGRQYRTVSFSYPYLGPTSVFGDHTSFGDDFAASINNIEKARSDPVIVSLHPGNSPYNDLINTTSYGAASWPTDLIIYGYITSNVQQYILPDGFVNTITIEELERP